MKHLTKINPGRLAGRNIKMLIALGMTEIKIREALNTAGVKVSQATINRLKNGRHEVTSFEVGAGLQQLVEKKLAKSGARKAG